MKKRILIEQIVIPFYRVEFLKALIDILGYENVIILSGNSTKTIAQNIKDYSSEIDSVVNSELKTYLNGSFYRLASFFRYACKSDIIVCTFSLRNINFYISLIMRVIFQRKKIIFWGHIHGNNNLLNGIRKFATRLGDGFVCYTKSDSTELKNPYFGLSIRNTYLGNSLYSLAQFDEIRQHFVDLGNEQKNAIIYSGRLIEGKGLRQLIKVYSKAFEKSNELGPLHLVGDGNLKAALKAEVNKLKLNHKIKFHDEMTDITTLATLYNNSMISICCGYIGLNAIQSFAYGTLMLYPKNHKHSPEIEACVENFNSYAYHSDDDLIEKIVNLSHNDSDFYDRIAIHDEVRRNYNCDNMANRFAEFIRRLSE